MPLVHAEPGCVQDQLIVDLPGATSFQQPAGPDTYIVVEQWESVEALQAHGGSAHMRDYGRGRREPNRVPRHPRHDARHRGVGHGGSAPMSSFVKTTSAERSSSAQAAASGQTEREVEFGDQIRDDLAHAPLARKRQSIDIRTPDQDSFRAQAGSP